MDKALPVSTMRYVVIIILALLMALPLLANDYQLFVASTMVVYCLVAVGLNTVLGYLGQLAFASAAFFGIGAYAAGLSMVHLGFGSLSAKPPSGRHSG